MVENQPENRSSGSPGIRAGTATKTPPGHNF